MKIAIIGGVQSTEIVIKNLYTHNFKDVYIWGYKPENTKFVSGWRDLELVAKKFKYKYKNFIKINNIEEELLKINPDIIFAVGISQIIPVSIITIPRLGCIGFHPTILPKGRGRAPVPWLILENSKGASTFFLIKKGIDDGPIISQVEFEVDSKDTANSIMNKLLKAETIALEEVILMIKNNKIISMEQNEKDASWYGKRDPNDGLINWTDTAKNIDCLIRASSHPYPGAYTFSDEVKIIIWEASLFSKKIKGVVGKILIVFDIDHSFVVQTSKGLIHIKKWSSVNWHPKVGLQLGYKVENEIFNLKQEILELKNYIEEIKLKFK